MSAPHDGITWGDTFYSSDDSYIVLTLSPVGLLTQWYPHYTVARKYFPAPLSTPEFLTSLSSHHLLLWMLPCCGGAALWNPPPSSAAVIYTLLSPDAHPPYDSCTPQTTDYTTMLPPLGCVSQISTILPNAPLYYLPRTPPPPVRSCGATMPLYASPSSPKSRNSVIFRTRAISDIGVNEKFQSTPMKKWQRSIFGVFQDEIVTPMLQQLCKQMQLLHLRLVFWQV